MKLYTVTDKSGQTNIKGDKVSCLWFRWEITISDNSSSMSLSNGFCYESWLVSHRIVHKNWMGKAKQSLVLLNKDADKNYFAFTPQNAFLFC